MQFSSTGANTTSEQEEFGRQLMDAMRQCDQNLNVSYDHWEFELMVVRLNGKREGLPLQPLFASFASRPQHLRQAFIEDTVWSMESNGFIGTPPPDSFATFAEAQHLLFPRVISRSEADWGAEQAYGPEGTDLVRPDVNQKLASHAFGTHLLITLVQHHKPGHEFLIERTLEAWNVTFAQALEVALANLFSKSKQPFQPIGPGIFAASYKDGFDAARIFLLNRFSDCSLKGDPVALLPERDTLLFTGSEDYDGLAAIFEMTKNINPVGLLTSPFVLQGNQWHVFSVPGTHPAANEIASRNLMDMIMIGNQQSLVMERQLKRQNRSLIPMPIRAVQYEGEPHVTSIVHWVEEFPNPVLLPWAQQLAFIRKAAEGQQAVWNIVDFDSAREKLPDVFKAMGTYPERYLAEKFPSEEQLLQLGVIPDCSLCEEHRIKKAKFCNRCGKKVAPLVPPWPPKHPFL